MQNLDPAHYFDPAIYAADVERIFSRTWQLIGPASRLAERGDYIASVRFVERIGPGVIAVITDVQSMPKLAPIGADGQFAGGA